MAVCLNKVFLWYLLISEFDYYGVVGRHLHFQWQSSPEFRGNVTVGKELFPLDECVIEGSEVESEVWDAYTALFFCV